jgi:hypothetical protein
MNGYVTQQRLARTVHVPFAVAQTELRAGKNLIAAVVMLAQDQRMEVRSLTLNVLRILTTGVTPSLRSTAANVCSVGIYAGDSDACPVVYTNSQGNAASTSNPNRRHIVCGPGKYTVLIKNNTFNVDLSVVASGAAKIYY